MDNLTKEDQGREYLDTFKIHNGYDSDDDYTAMIDLVSGLQSLAMKEGIDWNDFLYTVNQHTNSIE